MLLQIKEIEVDGDIYPRQHQSKKTIEAYIEALKASAVFPPIQVQKISVDEKEEIIILDGAHRLEAFKASGKTEIDAEFWNSEVLEKKVHLNELRLQAAKLNRQHGDRLSAEDMKFDARRIAEDDPDKKWSEEAIANELGIFQQTVSDWISDIRARQTAGRNNLIYRLSILGWSQGEIAKKTTLTQQAISRITNSTEFGKICSVLQEWLGKGKSVEQAAVKLEIDETLAQAILLREKTDDERLESLEIEAKKYTVWNFSSCHKLMGQDSFEGRIPGEIPLNFLYYFTKPNELVVDPMAGGGPTVDAALLLGRKCKAYDLDPKRPETEGNDILNGYPNKLKNVDAIFCNPPYWCSVDYGEGLSSLSLDEFYKAMEQFIKETFALLKSGGHFGIIMANQSTRIAIEQKRLPEDFGHRLEHILKMYNYCIEAGFQPWWRIICPLSTQGAQDWAQGEWDLGRLGEINREFLIFKK